MALAMCLSWSGPGHAQVPDHLKCYRVKDSLKLAGKADLDTPQFGADPGCTVSKAKLFCVPATKTNVAVTDKKSRTPITPLPITGPDPGDRICYKVKCPAPPTPIAEQSVTDQFGNRTVAKLKASLLCTPAFKGSVRFVDNGDGTVTDDYTGLQWEKKDGADGTPDFGNPHDVDNTYGWAATAGGSAADGTAFSDFLSRLNACTSPDGASLTPAFAGHCDWRLPTIVELQTILLEPAPCGTHPCIAPVFGAAAADSYWSSTSEAGDPMHAWAVSFFNGLVGDPFKNSGPPIFFARAVRGGS